MISQYLSVRRLLLDFDYDRFLQFLVFELSLGLSFRKNESFSFNFDLETILYHHCTGSAQHNLQLSVGVEELGI